MKLGFMALLAFVAIFASTNVRAETRTLEMYYVNTGEKTSITFKKNGRYIASGLDKMNRFLRDWRRKEHIKMDPRLFDLVWEVRKAAGSRRAIHVVSAYRSPATNNMLRRTRGGQARKSQHMVGKAMDFYIPGVKSSTLRKIGLRKGWGGVGYYPRSGSPYVHLDTGRVRHWPRMSRKQLVAVFPNGRTLHVPTDGKPLKGYKQAQADDKRIRAGKSPTNRGGGGGGLLAALRGGNSNDDDVADSVPTPRPVRTAATPRVPIPRAAIPAGGVAGSGFDTRGASAGGGPVPEATPAPIIGPIDLPLIVASPVFNPRTPATTITPDGLPTPEGPLTPEEPAQSEVLVARATEGETEPEQAPAETLVAALTPTEVPPTRPVAEIAQETAAETVPPTVSTALVQTDVVPRLRPEVAEPKPVDATLVASIPQPDFRPAGDAFGARFGDAPPSVSLTAATSAPAPRKFNAPAVGEPVTSPRFNSRITIAHAFAPEASPSARARAVLAQLRGSQPLSGVSDSAAPVASAETTAAQPQVQVAVLPRPAPRPQAVASEAPETGSGLTVAAPQFDVASATEFTQDGSMALGTLNGATVLGWAITPLDPIKVQARGLRAPAYGQNALRLAPTVVLQKQLNPIGNEPEWTSFDEPESSDGSPLKLASLD